jgi:hypothetical protein
MDDQRIEEIAARHSRVSAVRPDMVAAIREALSCQQDARVLEEWHESTPPTVTRFNHAVQTANGNYRRVKCLEEELRLLREERDRLANEMSLHCQQRIETPCPTCGHRTLFIAVGGHLTCSWLPCREPGLEYATTATKARAESAEAELQRLKGLVDGVLSDYSDELDKAACDRCEHCNPLVMCSFHSVLSVLQGHTAPTKVT